MNWEIFSYATGVVAAIACVVVASANRLRLEDACAHADHEVRVRRTAEYLSLNPDAVSIVTPVAGVGLALCEMAALRLAADSRLRIFHSDTRGFQ